MDFLVNDASLHGQFYDLPSFQRALDVLMSLRAAVLREGRTLACHRSFLGARVLAEQSMQQVIAALPRVQQTALLAWATHHGPFWDDLRQHGPDDWLEYRDEIVTDTALGEAAFANCHGADRHVVSFCPSNFTHDPIDVLWQRGEQAIHSPVTNHWELEALRNALATAPVPITTWQALESRARLRFDLLTFSSGAFEPLLAQPFSHAASERLLFLFATLDRLRRCYGADGSRSSEGHELYQNFFTGKKGDGGRGAMFTDSSDSEKADFASQLRFPHPVQPGEFLDCPWHGKVQTPQIRVHFSYPIRAGEPVYVVYVGPKLTKR